MIHHVMSMEYQSVHNDSSTPVSLADDAALASMKDCPMRAVLTRPEARQAGLKAYLEGTGWQVLSMPALELVALSQHKLPPENRPEHFDWVMFVSRTAWQVYSEMLGQTVVWPAAVGIAVVGQSTQQVIREQLDSQVEILAPVSTDSQDSESLWLQLRPRLKPGARVLIVAGREGRRWLLDQLTGHGIDARLLEVYERRPAGMSAETQHELRSWVDLASPCTTGVWLLTSRHGIESVCASLVHHGLLGLISPAAVIVTHNRLVSHARSWLAKTRAAADCPVLVCSPDQVSLQYAFDQIRAKLG